LLGASEGEVQTHRDALRMSLQDTPGSRIVRIAEFEDPVVESQPQGAGQLYLPSDTMFLAPTSPEPPTLPNVSP
jgi:hypothetical protein